jgi:plastocyanin
VTIRDYTYSPSPLRIRAGSTVTIVNRDTAPHTATDDGGRWDTGALSQGQSATVTFDTPGTYTYFCTLHPTMKGRVVVG